MCRDTCGTRAYQQPWTSMRNASRRVSGGRLRKWRTWLNPEGRQLTFQTRSNKTNLFTEMSGTSDWKHRRSERGMSTFATMHSPRLAASGGLSGIRGNTDELRQRPPVPWMGTVDLAD